MNVVFLLDKSNNWIEPFVEKYVENKTNFKVEYNHSKIKNNDIVFILGYTKIFDNNFLSANRLNLVVHESALPKGKGFAPIQWQILEGKNEIVFTLFEAIKEVDAGDIFMQKKVVFNGYELFDEIREIQGRKTIELIDEFLKKYPNIKKTTQSGEATVYSKRKDKDDMLDVNQTIKEQFNHLRVANNNDYPVWFEIDGHKYNLRIYKAEK
jgi:methionyl-tRNA formyltransferase